MSARLLKIFCLSFLTALMSNSAMAQEFNCKVKVMHDKIQNTDPAVFTAMERGISDFINTRKWTTDEWKPAERIDCTLLINLTSKDATDQDLFGATFSISATRPVYNSGYTSPLINYMDRDLVFHFSQYTPLQFDDNRVAGSDPLASNLTAVIAYYSYLILGFDYDSFSPTGGTAMFKKAQNVVTNAPEQSGIRGWKAFEDKRNRYWMVDQILSPRFDNLRKYWYTYHREALDMMYNKPAEGRTKVLAGIKTLSQLQKDNPDAGIIQYFFNAKSDELMRILAQAPREERAQYIPLLSTMDVVNATKYGNLR